MTINPMHHSRTVSSLLAKIVDEPLGWLPDQGRLQQGHPEETGCGKPEGVRPKPDLVEKQVLQLSKTEPKGQLKCGFCLIETLTLSDEIAASEVVHSHVAASKMKMIVVVQAIGPNLNGGSTKTFSV